MGELKHLEEAAKAVQLHQNGQKRHGEGGSAGGKVQQQPAPSAQAKQPAGRELAREPSMTGKGELAQWLQTACAIKGEQAGTYAAALVEEGYDSVEAIATMELAAAILAGLRKP